jgi:hypothetical protein
MQLLPLVVLLLAACIVIFLFWRKNRELVAQYAPIIDVRAEVRRAREEATRLRSSAQADAARLRAAVKAETDAARSQITADQARSRTEAEGVRAAARSDAQQLRADTKAEMEALRSATMSELAALNQQKADLSKEYASARAFYDKLKQQLGKLEENLEEVSVGLYKPHYRYDSSEEYKKALDLIRDREKDLVKAGKAAICGKAWNIEGDAKEGQRMTKQYLKLILRAFNGECDAAIAKVSWNNVTKMEERLRDIYDAVNDCGRIMDMKITPDYFDLKLAELRLEYETNQKKHEEQEEQRRIREQMREEERAQKEMEKAQREAQEEEERYAKAIEKVRAEMAKAEGAKLEELQLKIKNLDEALHKAQTMKEKVRMMAQLTRSGHVYVISNVGSFGENVFKIGMTRRLHPEERVYELGDASVPFDFDIHAMIYSEDAPTLEGAFQQQFKDRAVNLVNPRKEFFAVSIDEIQEEARRQNVKVEITKLAEAEQYRQTLALRAEARKTPEPKPAEEELPASI